MGFGRQNIYLLLAIILSLLKYTKGSCEFTDLPRADNVCVASLKCDQVINADLSLWNCIRIVETEFTGGYYYDNQGSYKRRTTEKIKYATNYKLNVKVRNADEQNDIFDSFAHNMINIRTIQIDSGNIYSLPLKVYQLFQATAIEVSNNRLSSIDLNRFNALTQLTTIKLRNNTIDNLEMETQAEYVPSRSIKEIDLSYNYLKGIPNTCFSRFIDLQHLNLSHNRICSFDILTFEGVMELKTIDVSHNMLFEIGNSLTRFINLRELYLQNNKLTNLADYNLNTLSNLETLNLSSNVIDRFENNTFKSLIKLEYLDLGNNLLEEIPKTLFAGNNNLHSLLISKNRINHIEDDAFDGKNITEFNLQENNITGSIGQDTFRGVYVTELDLSNQKLASLASETFNNMCNHLTFLNVSFNMIHSIAHSAFSCLDSLTKLDLSHNRLDNLYFETSSLTNLSMLNLSNNSVEKITKSKFQNFISLKKLDLSHNKITEIESQTFMELFNLEVLTVAHNPFVNILERNTFDGLTALKNIDLSFTRTTSYHNESFSGLTALTNIDSSFGQLSDIAYNAFIRTGSIEKLNFSHNLLDSFCINTSTVQNIEEIYLNDNIIRRITNNTFFGLKWLRILNLANNNIQIIDGLAFKNVVQLSHLYLSCNTQMEINGNPFYNLTNLYQVNMDGIKTRFTFRNVTNVKIENLDLHSCRIQDLDKLFVFKIENLRELNLSANEILTIDKFSFQSIPDLIKLDLSSNRISSIQPGSFLHLARLRNLSLFGNSLIMLQFGVFDGLKTLDYVNISSNALQSFDANLLPDASVIALDNNDISNFNFKDVLESEVKKLSIGGNPISCKVLVELKSENYSEKFKQVITTAILDFHSENVDGISCQSSAKTNGIVLPVTNNTSFDVRRMLIQFTNAVNNLRSSVEIVGHNTSPGKVNEIKSGVMKIGDSIRTLIDITNQTQIHTQILNDVKEQLFNLANKANDFTLNRDTGDNKIVENYDKIVKNNDIQAENMLNEEINAMRKEFEKRLQNIEKRDPLKLTQISEKETRDDKILYVIAACLGFIILLYTANILYNYLKRDRRSKPLHNSRRPITSEMEME